MDTSECPIEIKNKTKFYEPRSSRCTPLVLVLILLGVGVVVALILYLKTRSGGGEVEVPTLMAARKDPTQEEWEFHMERVHNMSSCGDPVPRLVKMQEFYPRNDHYDPIRAVVYRCERGVGVCAPTADCGPLETERIEVPIEVVDATRPDHHEYKWFCFVSHTKCGCVDRPPVGVYDAHKC